MRQRRVGLQVSTFDQKDIDGIHEVLESTMVVMGEKTREFERRWSDWQGSPFSLMVNSGSSANLLITHALVSRRGPYRLEVGDEVLVPAVTWSTTVFPILQLGLKPVLVDVKPDTFNMDVDSCRRAMSLRTRAMFAVHLLGNPAHLDELSEFCGEHRLVLLEDCCESHGAMWNGQRAGAFGAMSSFSYMFAHHISTVEGGMVCCASPADRNVLTAARAHGWIRELPEDVRRDIVDQSDVYDDRFVFWDVGFNLRPTEISASLGITQLSKIDNYIRTRNRNFDLYQSLLDPLADRIQMQVLEDDAKSVRSNFAFGFYIRDTDRHPRRDLFEHLRERGVECRPLVAGNIARHPFYDLYCEPPRVALPVSDAIHRGGLYVPNNQSMDEADVEYVASCVREFFD